MSLIQPDLNDVLLFAKVVEKASFTAAAAALELRVPTVSRRIARLEEQLGTRLLHRTTRKLSLTDAGRVYHRLITSGLEQLDAANMAMSDLQSEARGRVRFTSVPGMGRFAWEMIERFMAEHPKVSVEMNLTERRVDLVGEGYDVALRAGKLPDSSLISKHLADTHFAIFAAPQYLEIRSEPENPEDLGNHECIVFGASLEGAKWALCQGRRRRQVAVSGRLATTNLESIFHACRGGHGLGYLPTSMCASSVAAGQLVRVLPQWDGTCHGMYIVYPSRQHVSPSVRAFIDFVGHHVDAAIRRGAWVDAWHPRLGS